MSDDYQVWLSLEFRGFASSGQPLFSINGGQTQFSFSHDDLLEAFLGMLPTEDPALGQPVHVEPGRWKVTFRERTQEEEDRDVW